MRLSNFSESYSKSGLNIKASTLQSFSLTRKCAISLLLIVILCYFELLYLKHRFSREATWIASTSHHPLEALAVKNAQKGSWHLQKRSSALDIFLMEPHFPIIWQLQRHTMCFKHLIVLVFLNWMTLFKPLQSHKMMIFARFIGISKILSIAICSFLFGILMKDNFCKYSNKTTHMSK